MAKARFTLDGHLGEIVLADPPLNLFGLELSRDLANAAMEARDSPARAVLVRAEGENFSAGANVETFRGRDLAAARELIEEFLPMIRGFGEIEVPTVAAAQGLCLAAGLEVALTCDLIWAEHDPTGPGRGRDRGHPVRRRNAAPRRQGRSGSSGRSCAHGPAVSRRDDARVGGW